MATPSPPVEREYDPQQANGAGDDNNGGGNNGGDNNGDGNDGGVGVDPPPQPGTISLTFANSNNFELTFKLKRSTKLSKAMDLFAERSNMQQARFIHEGDRIFPDTTPESMEMEDGDRIEVYQEQIGGGEVSK
ncbi:SUMO protein smt3 [Elasticomyces elasticus]|nr:SUMO protein smt3 [Elasticomyces elasticus]